MTATDDFLSLIHPGVNFDRVQFIRALGGGFHDEITGLFVDDFGAVSHREYRLCLPLLLTSIEEQDALIAHNDVSASIILNRPFLQYLRHMDEDLTLLGELKARIQITENWLAPILSGFSQVEIVAATDAVEELRKLQEGRDGSYFLEELSDLRSALSMALEYWAKSIRCSNS